MLNWGIQEYYIGDKWTIIFQTHIVCKYPLFVKVSKETHRESPSGGVRKELQIL